jgi:hypothetical protein
VYGVVSSGYAFIFVTISHDGVLKQSKTFDVNNGEILTILGSLKYVLEMSGDISPNVTPEKAGDVHSGDYDPDVDIDNVESLPE